jgi:hypothetical protein
VRAVSAGRDGNGSYFADAIYANDTWQFSIMLYSFEPNYDGSSYRSVITPPMADRAVQSITACRRARAHSIRGIICGAKKYCMLTAR